MTTTLWMTGMGAIGPLGNSLIAMKKAVQNNEVALRPYQAMEQATLATDMGLQGGEVQLPADTAPEDRAWIGTQQAIEQAFNSAGIVPDALDMNSRLEIIAGTSLHGIPAAGSYLRNNDLSYLKKFSAESILEHALAKWPNIQHPRITTCTACASGLNALQLAQLSISNNQADMVLVIGYDPISEYAVAGFHALRVFSPTTPKPFGKDRDGMQVSEGYAAVILENPVYAKAYQRAPLALLAGTGSSSDSHHLTQPHPEGLGATQAIQLAISQASNPTIDLASAHATATRDNDAAEAQAWLAAAPKGTPVVGLKSRHGHTLGAAGLLEALLCSQWLDTTEPYPSTANVSTQTLDELAPAVITTPGTPAQPILHTAHAALGFGGANTCAVLAAASLANKSTFKASNPASNIAISGIGIMQPHATGGRDAVTLTPSIIENEQIANLSEWIHARRTRRLSRLTQLSLAAAKAAFDDAQCNPTNHPTMSGWVGTTHGAVDYCFSYYQQLIEDGLNSVNPMPFAEGVPNASAAHLAMAYGIHGPCQALIGSTGSGLHALRYAALGIASRLWPKALVVCAEESHDLPKDFWTHLHQVKPTYNFESAVAFVLEPVQQAQRPLACLNFGDISAEETFTHNDLSSDTVAPYSTGSMTQIAQWLMNSQSAYSAIFNSLDPTGNTTSLTLQK